MKHKPIHVENELFITELPADCIAACSHSGDCLHDVEYWRKKLHFTVNRENAIRYLKSIGGWTDKELMNETDDGLARKVLWLAAGDFSEFICECEGKGLDPFDEKLEYQSNSGSNTFTLL